MVRRVLIPQSPIGWTGNTTAESIFGKRPEQVADVLDDDARRVLLKSKWKRIRPGVRSFCQGDFATVELGSVKIPFVRLILTDLTTMGTRRWIAHNEDRSMRFSLIG